MTTPEADITACILKQKGATVVNMTAAGLGPLALKKMGVPTAAALRELGFDALHLADARFAAEAAAAFGSNAVVASFVSDASDAVAVAGSAAAEILGITCADLLACCAGGPVEAHAVLQQLEQGSALENTPVKILLDTGIRSAALADVGRRLFGVGMHDQIVEDLVVEGLRLSQRPALVVLGRLVGGCVDAHACAPRLQPVPLHDLVAHHTPFGRAHAQIGLPLLGKHLLASAPPRSRYV